MMPPFNKPLKRRMKLADTLLLNYFFTPTLFSYLDRCHLLRGPFPNKTKRYDRPALLHDLHFAVCIKIITELNLRVFFVHRS
jgi:hypothetical protein